MARLILPPVTAALLLAGCAAVPDLGPRPQVRSAQAYAATESFRAPTADWPSDQWWKAYGDAQLDGLVGEALAGSPSLVQAQARLRAAQARVQQSRAALLPGLTANAQAAQTKQSYNNGIPPAFTPQGYNDTGRATLDLSFDLDLWGKNRAALAAATSEATAAEMDAVQARLVLTTALVGAYADLSRAFAQQEAAEQARVNRQATRSLVAQRVANGAANQGELRQAEAGLASGPPRLLDAATARPATVDAARLRAQAAARRIDVAHAAFYPNVNLAAFAGAQSLGLDMLTKSGSDIGQAGLAVSLPIFQGGRLSGAYRGARAEYDAAVASYDATLVQALREVADAAAGERALAERLTAARLALAKGEEAYRIARLRYEGGLDSFTAVLTAENAVIQQRRAAADLEARALTLDAALVRALGGGFRAA